MINHDQYNDRVEDEYNASQIEGIRRLRRYEFVLACILVLQVR